MNLARRERCYWSHRPTGTVVLHSQPGSLFLNQEHRCWIAIICVLLLTFFLDSSRYPARAVRPHNIFWQQSSRATHEDLRARLYG